jgi:hypothetical protein
MKIALAAVLAAVLAGALGFYGGVTYQKSQTQSPFAGRSGGQGGPMQGNRANGQRGAGRFGGNMTTGTVIAQDGKSVTIKLADGGSKALFVSSTTEISQQQVLTTTDIKVGDQVAAFGQQATGGIDARMIQVVPPGGSFRFGGAGGADGAGGPGGPPDDAGGPGGPPDGAPSGP